MEQNRQLNKKRISALVSQLAPVADSMAGSEAAGERLRMELQKPEAQKIWSRYLSKNIATNKNVLSYRAISRAISAAQFERYGIEVPPNRYKDRVRRALLGERLTAETLRLFADTFGFDQAAITYMSEMIALKENVVVPPTEKRIPRFDITTTFYDIFINEEHLTYKIRCYLVLRALEDSCYYFWAPVGTDIQDIEIHRGASLQRHEDLKLYYFELEKPLNTSESGELDYTLHVSDVPDIEGAVMAIQYHKTRSNVFFRFFFDDPQGAPEALKCSRKNIDNEFSAEETVSDLQVHEGRASYFLSHVANELILFYLSP